jgi:hypothetical protein
VVSDVNAPESEDEHEEGSHSRASEAELELLQLRRKCKELRARIRELEIRLENALERERALDEERIDLTRRAAAALADAQRELDRLAAAQSDPFPRKGPKGNWLR